MTWRAHIDRDRGFLTRTVRIYLLDEFPGGYVRVNPGGESLTRVDTQNEGIADPEPEPTLIIPNQAAPALLAALAKHLGAVEHPEQLRRDYEAERKRVDLFIAHLTGGSQ